MHESAAVQNGPGLRAVIDPAEPSAGLTPAPDPFAQCYEANHTALVRLAYVLTGSADVAQDLVQDAFVGLHRRFGSVDQPVAYVRRSVVNASRSHHRRTARVRTHEVPGSDRERVLEAVPSRGSDAPDELSDALAALPHRQRAAIVLRFYADLPDAAIADALGCRVGTVASLIHRGLAALREVIER